MKKLFICFLSLGLFYTLSINTAFSAAPPTKVVISYAVLSEREGALFVARDQGFFRKQGLDVDLVYVSSAPVALASIAHAIRRSIPLQSRARFSVRWPVAWIWFSSPAW